MWYELFHTMGKLAGSAAGSVVSGLGVGRAQAKWHSSGRRGRNKDDISAIWPDLTENRLLGAALAATVETGRAMLNRPSVRASLEAAVLKMLGLAEVPHGSVEPVRHSADTIVRVLQERGVVPRRIGVDGVPGSGKSTLARALADRLGFQWKSLDHEDMNVPRDFSREGVVYEHHRLFRTQDVDSFDAIVYIDEPVEVSRGKILERAKAEARQGLSADVLNYDRMKKIGEVAFHACDGEPIAIPQSSLVMKIKPPGGFRAMKNTASRVHAAGHQTEGWGKEEMLFVLAYGSPRSGLMAYLLPGAYNQELFNGLLAGLRRYLAASGANR